MNYTQTLEYIESLGISSRPGLERISRILGLMGNPQEGMNFIHVAGTNGKGSFCAMTESILRAAGYKTGLYISPHIMRLNERMSVKGSEISDDELADIATFVRQLSDRLEDRLTEFEFKTAAAFEYFRRCGCDVVVLEVGMGGRLDATNVITSPVLSVITGVSLDHMSYIGDTIEKIAHEKAGIIKPGYPVFWGGKNKAAARVIAAQAAELGSPYHTADYSKLDNVRCTLTGADFDFGEYKNLHINLLGLYQPINAAGVLEAIPVLRGRGFVIPVEAVRRGLASTVWPARFELLSADPVIIYDGSHNPEAIEAATRSIRALLGGKYERVNILTGVMRDKDYATMAGLLSGIARKVFVVTANYRRALPADEYAEVFRRRGVQAYPYDVLDAGIRAAYEDSEAAGVPLVILGSFYLYADVKEALGL
ncbi:MAG TPA: bifunctional folylpolyglutamate synthase/dihydrofolate synthase [Clostridiales bacterium]|jgi:dihydrofolate synthase/folylpolyglutamate synthase|nr:bifunctional folylpolyglutamate synthase/dihydrofolate synthase [Clostridiales bacterium]